MKNSWLKYFLYLLAFCLFIFLGQYLITTLRAQQEKTFELNMVLNYTLSLLFFVGIGILIGLESTFKQIKKKGIWKVNITKILILGIPSLYFSFFILLYYSNIPAIRFLTKPFEIVITNGNVHMDIFQILLGYVLITSLYKSEQSLD